MYLRNLTDYYTLFLLFSKSILHYLNIDTYAYRNSSKNSKTPGKRAL